MNKAFIATLCLLSFLNAATPPLSPDQIWSLAKNFYQPAPSHPSASHHPYVSSLGDSVELEDGSLWLVNPADQFKTYNWQPSDNLKLTPNHIWYADQKPHFQSWFSEYPYCFHNLTTQESIEVKMMAPPVAQGLYTLWIEAIDVENYELILSDGTVWKLSGLYYRTFKEWKSDQILMVGHNEGFFAKSWGNILINCDTLSYVEARMLRNLSSLDLSPCNSERVSR